MMHWFYFEAFFKRKDTKWLDIIWNVQSLKGNTRDKSSSPALNKVDVLRSPVSKIPIFSGHCLMCKLHKKCSYRVFLFCVPNLVGIFIDYLKNLENVVANILRSKR